MPITKKTTLVFALNTFICLYVTRYVTRLIPKIIYKAITDKPASSPIFGIILITVDNTIPIRLNLFIFAMAEVSPLSCNTRKIRAEQIEQRNNIVIIPAKSEKKPNSDKSVITKNINTTKII